MQFNQPDAVIPDLYNPQSLNRFSYVNNNPVRYIDPTGHMMTEGCGDEGKTKCHASDLEITLNAQKLAELEFDSSGQKQKKNRQTAETILYGGTELLSSVLFEPADWAYTAYHCANGDCSPWMLAGLLPFIPSSVAKHLDDVPWKSIVEKSKWGIIETAFKGDSMVYQAMKDLHVFRRYSGELKVSPWFSLKPYVYPGNARRYLALPDKNLATNVAEFIIPKDTKFVFGKVASQISDSLFGSHAVGGGLQIYLPDPFEARRIK
jgi:hypothetical protein